jgi:anti-sigma B factor antagonist
MKTGRPVLVMQLPPRLNLTHAREFLPEVMTILKSDRPRMVFDFSEVCQIDSAGVEMLLKCLEKVMKLDGDLKLAGLTPEASIILELTRVDRLFEIFSTVDDAVDSFNRFYVPGMPHSSSSVHAGFFPGAEPSNGRLVG